MPCKSKKGKEGKGKVGYFSKAMKEAKMKPPSKKWKLK